MKTIETERLVLKAIECHDAMELFDILHDAQTAWWADLPIYSTLHDVLDFIDWGNWSGDIIQYGLFERESDTLIGFLQVKLPQCTGRSDAMELGYVLSKDHRGQGYMPEAVNAVCEDIFRDGAIRRITLEILPDNGPSRSVARKCGFSLVGQSEEERELRFLDDRPLDLFVRENPAVSSAAA